MLLAFLSVRAGHPVGLIGVEAAGKGLDTNKHAATFNRGTVGSFMA